MKYWEGKDFYQNDLRYVRDIDSVDDCARICLDDAACVAFSYVNKPLISPNSTPPTQILYRCHLKKAAGSWTVNDMPELISGVRCDYNIQPGLVEPITGYYPSSSGIHISHIIYTYIAYESKAMI